MAVKQPDLDFANALAAAGLGTVGTDIRTGEPLSPTEPGAEGVKIWVWAHGGPAPEPYLGKDLITGLITATWDATVFVRVRGAADANSDGYDAALGLARQVLQVMTFNIPAGYIDLRSDMSQPEYLGVTEVGSQPQFQVVFSMVWVGTNGP